MYIVYMYIAVVYIIVREYNFNPVVTNTGLNELQIAFVCRETLKVTFQLTVVCVCACACVCVRVHVCVCVCESTQVDL